MPFEKKSTKTVKFSREDVYKSISFCVTYMGGQILKDDPQQKILHAQMDKKLFGDYLGDRSKLEIELTKVSKEETKIDIYAYPLNAVGQKLMFGARKGVVERMMAAFYEEVEKHLQAQEK